MTYDEQKKLLDEMTSKNVELSEEIMYERIHFQKNLEDEFLARLNQKWWRGFVALESMYHMTIECADNFKAKYYVERDNGVSLNYRQFALQNIHGRACQVFAEILCLLKNGYADGAFARWRTLFELSVFAIFIKENNDDVALSYINQSKDGEWEFQSGTEWAVMANCFKGKNGRMSFSKIFNSCKFSDDQSEFWQKQYRLSCKVVHASPQGTMKRLANSGAEQNSLPVGRSDWGLHSPAEHSAHSFFQVTASFFTTFADTEVVFETQVLRKWIDVVCKHIYETVRDCFPDVPGAKGIADSYFGE